MVKNRIVELAQNYFKAGFFTARVRELLRQDKHTKEELNELFDYCSKSQEIMLSRGKTELSMRKMKETIGGLIGENLSGGNYSGNNISRDDLFKIYKFITSLPEEYVKDRLHG